MDISSVSSIYTDYYTSAEQSTSRLENQLDGADYSTATDDELLDACKQFEAYFVEQMFKAMMKTVPASEGTSNYTSTMMDYYKDQMVQSMAEETSEQNSLGLAQMLYEQMKRNYGIVDIPEAESTNAKGTENAGVSGAEAAAAGTGVEV